MRILITTDAFPPVCGGSGWSTYELARGLRANGHHVVVMRPRLGPEFGAGRWRIGLTVRRSAERYDGFQPWEVLGWAPTVPFVRNYVKNERFFAACSDVVTTIVQQQAIEIIHAQHVLTAPPSISAAARAGVPVVCTVRDYWPLCYWGNLIYDRAATAVCPTCSVSMMSRCIRPRAGRWWPAAVPLIPYMRANLRRKREALARADAIVAVSGRMGQDLRARGPELRAARLETIPNPVDVAALRRQSDRTAPSAMRPADHYAIFVGKLEVNKGVGQLLPAIDRANLDWPLVVVGDGAERARLEEDARRRGRHVVFTGWLPRTDVWTWMRHAAFLIFPSAGPESLSRVLIEAGALALPVAALETGGTGDIVRDEETGLLSRSLDELVEDIARLRAEEDLRRRLGAAARRYVEAVFDTKVVVERLTSLYRQLTDGTTR